MFSDSLIKETEIKYKIITAESFDSVSELIQTIYSELLNEYPDKTVECLYEILKNNHLVTGPSFEKFKKTYTQTFSAESLRYLVQVIDPLDRTNTTLIKVELILSRKINSKLFVSGKEDNTRVNGIYTRLNQVIEDAPSKNGWVNSVYFDIFVQLLAVISITGLSIYTAQKYENNIGAQYGQIYLFAIIFLLLSNSWTFISRGLFHVRSIHYPKVDILKKPRVPVLFTSLIFVFGGCVTWSINYLLTVLFVTPA